MFHGLFHNSTVCSVNGFTTQRIASKWVLSCSLFLVPVISAFCQKHTLCYYENLAQVECFTVDSIVSIRDSIQQFTNEAYSSGFLAFRQDSVLAETDTTKAYFHRGRQYIFRFSQSINAKRKTELRLLTNQNIRAAALKKIETYENNGYPFAQLEITATLEDDSTLYLEPKIIPGKYVTYDSLIIDSDQKQRQAYFRQYLGLKRGRPYSEKDMNDMPRLIGDLNFVSVKRMPEVVFHEEQADVYLFLNEVKANSFDGIIGFQPDVETGTPVITGDVTLDLENAFRQGEQVGFRWRRIQEETQDLKLNAALPYLLSTRLGVWAGVELYRRDSSFTTSEVNLALGYMLGAHRYLRTFIENWSSNALRPDVSDVDNISIRRYGLGYQNSRLDRRKNPMKGYSLMVEASAGLKDLPDPENNDDNLRVSQFSGMMHFTKWIQLRPRFSLVLMARGGFKADSTIRLNEYYRIGGLNSLRGFDEEAFFARNYAVGTAELKYKLDETSAFFLFADQGWYDQVNDGYFSDSPLGFGTGAMIGTENSTFRIYYALGKEQGNPILVRNGKVHFGFINRF